MICLNKFRGRKSKPGARLHDASLPSSKGVALSSIAADVALEGLLLFCKFPQEIRLKIWAMVADEPRVVIIDQNRQTRTAEFRYSAPPPAILHVCVEAREVALDHYTLTFGRNGLPGRIYFNFDLDILFCTRARRSRNPELESPRYTREILLAHFNATGKNAFATWAMI